MKKNNKWFFYIKGTGPLVVILLAILLIFSGSIIWAEVKIGKMQIQNVYEQENDRLSIAFGKEINKCMGIARNLTVTQITLLPENFTQKEYERYYLELKQVSAIMLVSDQIAAIKLKYGDDYIVQNTKDAWEREDMSDPTFSYEYAKNTQLFWFEDEPKYLYMRYVPAAMTAGADEVLVKLSLSVLSETCTQSLNNEIRSYVALREGTILVSPSYNEIGKNINELYQNNRKWHLMKADSENGMNVVSALPSDLYRDYTGRSLLVGGVFSLFFLVLVVVLAYIYYTFFIKPIGNILEYIDPARDTNEYDRDVMNYISSHIVSLHGKNMDLDENMRQVLKELKLQQIISCQMQIKPHFLSNTLGAISWMAVEKYDSVDNPISNALTTLSDIYQSALALDEILVTVSQEKRDTEKYIEILKIRYGTRLHVEWEIEQGLEQELVLKTSIQPLVENCVGHAFPIMTDAKRICVSVRSGGERMIVSVTDNGIGIAPDKLQELEKAINDFESPVRKHVGLKNINRRIKLLYGKEYGLRIESVPGEYTRCYFEYPKSSEKHMA